MEERWASAVPCRDHANRNRLTRVIVNDKAEVVLIAPAGEVAVWGANELSAVKQAIADAEAEAKKLRWRLGL